MILFARHNVIRIHRSLISMVICRNVLIYLNRSIQERLIETFHFALRPGGFLFLGTSESPETVDDLSLSVDKPAHIFEDGSLEPYRAAARRDGERGRRPWAAARRRGGP